MNAITKAKNDELKTSVDRREIKLDHAESLLKDIASREINGSLKKNTTILLMIWMQYYRSQCLKEVK